MALDYRQPAVHTNIHKQPGSGTINLFLLRIPTISRT
jgi:hypothetical protein